jgi:hypothetical protein
VAESSQLGFIFWLGVYLWSPNIILPGPPIASPTAAPAAIPSAAVNGKRIGTFAIKSYDMDIQGSCTISDGSVVCPLKVTPLIRDFLFDFPNSNSFDSSNGFPVQGFSRLYSAVFPSGCGSGGRRAGLRQSEDSFSPSILATLLPASPAKVRLFRLLSLLRAIVRLISTLRFD